MNFKIAAIVLFALTGAAVSWYPALQAKHVTADPFHTQASMHKPVVDVVFVLDTTGSMSGLIQTAKDKIWSIASTMASAQPTPDIRIGLVGYRDRGDAYVTRVVDLSSNLDAVYSQLMSFEAGGGGDAPESVNRALYEAVHGMSWSERDQAYQVIFLVGDAPPHMDYDEVRYPEIIAAATEKGIVVNTVQCGDLPMTVEPWASIARLGNGHFFQVEQAGGAVAYATPFDDEIAQLSAALDATRLYYGAPEERLLKAAEMDQVGAAMVSASPAALARRGIFNATAAGRGNLLGDNELVEAVTNGDLRLEDLEVEELPEPLKPMAPAAQAAYVDQLAARRSDLQARIRQLAEDRDSFINRKAEEAGGLEDSLDSKLYETVREQAGKAGLTYRDGPAY